jgi:pectate lyase
MRSAYRKELEDMRIPLQSRAGLTSLLLAGIALMAPASAMAAITFDAASRAATTSTGRTSLSWSHAIGGGTDRMLLVGVAVEDASTADANITSVTFGGTPLIAVPNSKRSGGGTGIIQTQLFYLLSGSLGAAGSRTVTVTMQGAVDGIAAGAVSLAGVSQGAPQSAATNVDTSGADSISTSISSAAASSWVVDVVGSGNSGSFTASGGQTERNDVSASGMTGAMSTKALTAAGATTLGWAHNGANRLAHSLCSVAPSGGTSPQNFTLTTNVSGSGTVSRNPNASSYPSGTVVTLTATPAAGFVFSGWSGDLGGSASPTTITMSANRTVTATFTPTSPGPFTLNVSVTGTGTVTRSPNQATYPSGTVVTLTANAGAGFRFVDWSGNLAGTANPATIVMNANKNVVANFAPVTGNPNFGLFGFAATGPGTTGGGNLAPVNVNNLDQLRTLAGQAGPAVIRITGTITGNESIRVESNKSIVGAPGARLVGIGFTIGRSSAFGQVSNVIIRNLIMEKPRAPIDKVLVQYGAHHVWIDHNEFFSDLDNGVDFYDGQIDVTHGADFVTVSWNVFHDHFKNSLVGNSENTGDEDSGHLRVTYHHNLFTRVDGRNPSIRFGTGHIYNNHYLNIPDYGIASRQNAQVRIENNYFDNVETPIRADTSLSDVAGFVNQVNTNIFVNCGPNSITTSPGNFVPPYSYPLDAASSVPSIVQQGAGVGKVTF